VSRDRLHTAAARHALGACDARSQSISLEDDGIIRVQMQPGVFDLELADAQEVIRAISSLSGGVKRPVLVDLRGMRSMTRECRKDLGELAAACQLLEQALASALKTYGEDHPAVATVRHNLALVRQALGEPAVAADET
jgi:hypothetical protein